VQFLDTLCGRPRRIECTSPPTVACLGASCALPERGAGVSEYRMHFRFRTPSLGGSRAFSPPTSLPRILACAPRPTLIRLGVSQALFFHAPLGGSRALARLSGFHPAAEHELALQAVMFANPLLLLRSKPPAARSRCARDPPSPAALRGVPNAALLAGGLRARRRACRPARAPGGGRVMVAWASTRRGGTRGEHGSGVAGLLEARPGRRKSLVQAVGVEPTGPRF
jgi:hypothetical protein